jgi:hypothetical protein
MKTVYVSHSRDYDFKTELYDPLRQSSLNGQYKILLPHEKSDDLFSSRDFFRDECDVIVVEASQPKLGVGIEIGWADAFHVPIIVLIREGVKLSGSLRPMAKEIVTYKDSKEMIGGLETALQRVLS